MSTKKPSTKTKTTSPSQAINEIAFVLDSSGSMEGIWPDVLKTLKDNFSAIRSSTYKFGQVTNISFFVFGDHVRQIASSESINTFKLPEALYPNMGMTALYKAVYDATNYLAAIDKPSAKNKANMVIVLTDGQDNQSGELAVSLQKLIEKHQKTDRWSFAFMVPPGAESTITQRLGLPRGNVQAWENTTEGTRRAGAIMTSSFNNYYSVTRSSGATSTKGFFVTDLSKVKVEDIKGQLTDISGQVKIFTVPREMPIKMFVEEKLGQYRIGAAYYELTKDEKVASSKDILVIKKGDKKVWAGPGTRAMVGLPDEDVKIRPGNHANLALFVQSTSSTRLLVRGTKLVVVTT